MDQGREKDELTGPDGVKSLLEDGSVLKEDNGGKLSLGLDIPDKNNAIVGNSDAQSSRTLQKRNLFRRSMQLSRRLWKSTDHGSTKKTKKIIKCEKSMDDGMLLAGAKEIVEHELTNFDRLNEDIPQESFNNRARRGSICEEIEKKIFQGEVSLHEMRKAMIIEETLKERFI